MNSKDRMLTAIQGGKPDRLPVTTHHVTSYFLNKYMEGIDEQQFYDRFGLDAVLLDCTIAPDAVRGEWFDDGAGMVVSDNWRVAMREESGKENGARFYTVATPAGKLTTTLRWDNQKKWFSEPLIKNKQDIDILGEFVTKPICDVAQVNRLSKEFGERGILYGEVLGVEMCGYAGCWQDAISLVGIEALMAAVEEDPQWIHALLLILNDRKCHYVRSTRGAKYDLIEVGGRGRFASVITPEIFQEFVAPYDATIIDAAHYVGHRVVYHAQGLTMDMLDDIVCMNTDVIEGFAPSCRGEEVTLSDVKEKIGDRICMLGGFDARHLLVNSSPEKTREAVHKCFEQAGTDGRYIIAPNREFFDADPACIEVFADEARKCVYA